MVHFPLELTSKILEYLPSSKDKMNCRLVCYNWLYVVDMYVGVGLKLTRKNKAKVFYSDLLRTCTSLKIHESAGLLNWYHLPVSRSKLTRVEIILNIQTDNWELLLKSCESLKFLTITVSRNKYGFPYYVDKNKHKKFFPDTFNRRKIAHYSLVRIVIRSVRLFSRINDVKSVSNILDSLGDAPRLRQVVISWSYAGYRGTENIPLYSSLKTAILSLMERNPRITGIALAGGSSSFSNMDIWDRHLKDGTQCLVILGPFHFEGLEILQRFQGNKLTTVYYQIYFPEHLADFRGIANHTRTTALSLKTLYISLFDKPNGVSLDCNLLAGLHNLKELTVWIYRLGYYTTDHRLTNLSALTRSNLEYLYVSIPLSPENMTDIFAIPKLKELHIKSQDENTQSTRQNFDACVNHQSLKLLFLEAPLLEKWNQIGQHENWECFRRETETKVARFSKGTMLSLEEGFVDPKKWKKIFARDFVVLNTARLNDMDWTRIHKDYKKILLTEESFSKLYK